MKAFEYVNPTDVKGAVAALTQAGDKSKIIAGGIDLLGEMKDYIRTPDVVVNLKKIPGLNAITVDASGLKLGALVTLVEIAEHPIVRRDYTALADAAHVVGTPQIRNVGTLGGNLCQKPRCWYYRDEEVICLKKGGTTCYAVNGENQYHAILGGGPSYIVHPSDCAPALMALGATAMISSPKGTREVPLEKFFILPTESLIRENILQHNEIVTHIRVPKPAASSRSHYMKVRHKESFDWALAGAAVVLQMSGSVVKDSRVVLSGVAPIPWRSKEAEAALKGKTLTAAVANAAGAAAVSKAKPLGKNGYKVPLTQNTVKLAVLHAGGVKTG
jgi:xanthine dehydrogenase YagS FAD-binding subunit